jgi:hypothetical protein
MTVSEGQPTLSVDPEASLRAKLTGAIAAAQIDIANAIAELARSGADASALTSQSYALQQLQKQVGSANLGSLLALRSDVTATAASASALANQMVTTTTNAAAANANLTPAQRARANIEAIGRDLFERRVLDPYLRFTSAEEEEAYRKRERERAEAFDREMAKGTSEGDRRALQIQKAQLDDAKAHGAEGAPELARFEQRTDQALADLQQVSEASNRAPSDPKPGVGTTPVDESIDDLLATLKAAGVSAPADGPPANGHGVALAAAKRSTQAYDTPLGFA